MFDECRSSCCTESGTPEPASAAHHSSYSGSRASTAATSSRVRPPSEVLADLAGQGRGGGLGHPGSEHAVPVRGELDLGLGVPHHEALPPLPQLLGRGDRAEHGTGVAGERPRAVGAVGHQRRHQVRDDAAQQVDEGGLVADAGAVDLEPQPDAVGLEPDRARPRPTVRLLPLAGQGQTQRTDLLGDPAAGLLDEGVAGPQVDGHAEHPPRVLRGGQPGFLEGQASPRDSRSLPPASIQGVWPRGRTRSGGDTIGSSGDGRRFRVTVVTRRSCPGSGCRFSGAMARIREVLRVGGDRRASLSVRRPARVSRSGRRRPCTPGAAAAPAAPTAPPRRPTRRALAAPRSRAPPRAAGRARSASGRGRPPGPC